MTGQNSFIGIDFGEMAEQLQQAGIQVPDEMLDLIAGGATDLVVDIDDLAAVHDALTGRKALTADVLNRIKADWMIDLADRMNAAFTESTE